MNAAVQEDSFALFDRLAEASGVAVQRGVDIGRLTTYRVGGRAARFVEATGVEPLLAVARAIAASGIAARVIGRGSNLLVADRGFDGLAITLGPVFEHLAIDGCDVVAGGAASLPVVARRVSAAGLAGFEWAVGVPGSIGGAVRMNAGGHGSDMAAVLVQARVVSLARGDVRVVTRDELALGYRRSALTDRDVVVEATLRLTAGSVERSEALLAEIVRWRRDNQPGGRNAGSVFANPPGDSAGRLIDAAGCKGLRIGSAEVSTKHANFFLVDDDGSADDVAALMREVQRRVRARFGVELRPETHLVGFADRPDQSL